MVEETTAVLFDRIKSALPPAASISSIMYEGSEIVIYTKNKEFFADGTDDIKKIVQNLKKRIILRPDPSICMDMEKAIETIKGYVPAESGVKDIYFEPHFGKVVIEAEKPGLVIGKGGETLREIKRKTFWAPQVNRAPAIPSDIVRTLRAIEHEESEFRKDFLNKVGARIHSGWKETDWIRITGLGACREVGRSCWLVQTPESRVLLDCGIKPGNNELPYFTAPEFDVRRLDAVIIAHAHMDHCGSAPLLYKMGYDGPLYCTLPTRDQMALLCMDYIEVLQKEGSNALYSTKEIKEMLKRTITLPWGEVSDITPDIRLTLLNSGHILGSSLVHLHIGEGLYNILYTSDLKFDRTALYEPASTDFQRAETVIIESTYGASEDIQPRRTEAEANLVEACKKTVGRGGVALIPSFAVERSQDLIVILERSGLTCHIYLDGMVWDATGITTAYPEFMSKELQRQILQKGSNPFLSPLLKRIGSHKERMQVLESKEPCVVIATSGMLLGGPSVTWFQNIAENEKNSIIFVGYQSESSLGRKVQKGIKEVPIESNGRKMSLTVNCEVQTIHGLSGHSDIKQLINYLRRLKHTPERIVINHGEASKCLDFAKTAHRVMKCETIAPRALEALRLK